MLDPTVFALLILGIIIPGIIMLLVLSIVEPVRVPRLQAYGVREKAKRTARSKKIVTYALSAVGGASIVFSLLFTNSILAFVGLGLVFWGILFLYVGSVPYVKAEIIGPSFAGQKAALQQLIETQKGRGRAIYLPPKHLDEVSAGRVLLPSDDKPIATPSSGSANATTVKPKGLELPAPGLGLVEYYVAHTGSDFVGVDMEYLQASLPRLIRENLELAQTFEMTVDGNIVTIRTVGERFYELCSALTISAKGEEYLACPFHSSFAIVLARATGKSVLIESATRMDDARTIVATYKIGEP